MKRSFMHENSNIGRYDMDRSKKKGEGKKKPKFSL